MDDDPRRGHGPGDEGWPDENAGVVCGQAWSPLVLSMRALAMTPSDRPNSVPSDPTEEQAAIERAAKALDQAIEGEWSRESCERVARVVLTAAAPSPNVRGRELERERDQALAQRNTATDQVQRVIRRLRICESAVKTYAGHAWNDVQRKLKQEGL